MPEGPRRCPDRGNAEGALVFCKPVLYCILIRTRGATAHIFENIPDS